MKLLSPKFSVPPVPCGELPGADPEERIERIHFTKLSLLSENLKKREFSECVFSSCDLSGAALDGCDFSDCVFERCNLSGASFTKSSFRRVRFSECKGVGAYFSESVLRDFFAEKSAFSYSNFNAVRTNALFWDECDLSNADIALCALKNAQVHKCSFVRANFFNTPLKGLDLKDSDLSGAGFSASLTELKGAKINLLQAAAILRSLGIDAQ